MTRMVSVVETAAAITLILALLCALPLWIITFLLVLLIEKLEAREGCKDCDQNVECKK